MARLKIIPISRLEYKNHTLFTTKMANFSRKKFSTTLLLYLKVNSILSKFQSGFRPLHSTVSALIQMCDDWSENMEKGKLTGVVFS